MPGHAPVGVDDDLAPGQSAVRGRAAEDEATGRIDEEPVIEIAVEAVPREHRGHDLVADRRAHLRLRYVRGMLGRHEHALNGDGAAIPVADRDLRLPVGTQPRQRAVAANRSQSARQHVRQRDGQRHQRRRLRRGVPEHRALVARADQLRGAPGANDAAGDVAGLGAQAEVHVAGIGAEARDRVGVGVADLAHDLAGELLEVGLIDRGGRGDLAREDDQVARHESLTGHARRGTLGQEAVQQGIGDLVGHLVRMAFRHRFGAEEQLARQGGPLTKAFADVATAS